MQIVSMWPCHVLNHCCLRLCYVGPRKAVVDNTNVGDGDIIMLWANE